MPLHFLQRSWVVFSDFNECEVDGTCSQECHNTNGSYHCSCVEGYQLKVDGRGCKALGACAYGCLFVVTLVLMSKRLIQIFTASHLALVGIVFPWCSPWHGT